MGERPLNQQAAAFLTLGGLPLIALIVLLGTGQLENSDVSLMVFPLGFAALAWILCRRLDLGKAWSSVYTLGCAAACWLVAATAGLFASLFLSW